MLVFKEHFVYFALGIIFSLYTN